MPTVIFLFGWRFFFYSDEGNEPLHIHCEKAEKEAKFWLDERTRAITVSFAHNFSSRDMKEVKNIIGQYFEEIIKSWKEVRKMKGH
ncbi:MAG: DUF4160 domain-containing protein [Opitutaceae bacterium]|jgi:hypothetical protein